MTDVYEAAMERIAYVFDNFDKVLVSFSGGKDSTVCLEMCYDYAKEHKILDRLAMYHLDYEAQYQMTTDFVTNTFVRFSDIETHWLCLPVGASCGCRMDSATWIPWRKADREIWVREYPGHPSVMTEDDCPFDMTEGQKDYDVQDAFCRWMGSRCGSLAVMIGIRADESLDRRKLVTSTAESLDMHRFDGKKWTVGSEGFTRIYPIYDWRVSDVWTYLGKYGKPYNKLYDLYYQAGLTIDQMRVANPFHSCGTDNLRLYKVIDPNTWGKMVGRVNGVNFAGLYGGTTAMGWKRITKPSHFTWRQYCYFLLDTLDEPTRAHYMEKLETSLKFWKDKGGVLEEDTVRDLSETGIEYIDKGIPEKSTNGKHVIAFDDYPDDVDISDFRSCPSYKRMCVCIIKNDYYCKYMGFTQTKTELEKRKRAMRLYKDL